MIQIASSTPNASNGVHRPSVNGSSNNTTSINYSGTATGVAVEGPISYTSSPVRAAEWVGKINITTPGLTGFTIPSDDGGRLYIDGVQKGTLSSGTGGVDPAGNVYFGARNNLDPARFLLGGMDGVSLYDRALSASEVAANWSGGSALATVNMTVLGPPTVAASGGAAGYVENAAPIHHASAQAERQLVDIGHDEPVCLVELRKRMVQVGTAGYLIFAASARGQVIRRIVERFRERVVRHQSQPVGEPPVEL